MISSKSMYFKDLGLDRGAFADPAGPTYSTVPLTVFGDGKVAQFTTHSYPSIGFGLMLLTSLLTGLAALIRRKQLAGKG